jgi:hypothetical protein
LALRNQKALYEILFRASSETLKELTGDPKHLGAQIGFIALLHTWSQTLMDHPHLHCIVTAGGLSPDGKRWIPCNEDFFLPVKVVSRLFRGKFLAYLKKAYEKNRISFPGKIAHLKEERALKALLNTLYGQEWNVYCKPSFRNAETLMEYLGRYTHRVAISNDRLVKMQGDQVTFKYRDRNDNDQIKLMTLDASEFIRRFLLHILPDGFVKIRHYGILSTRNRKTNWLSAWPFSGSITKTRNQEKTREPWEDLLEQNHRSGPQDLPLLRQRENGTQGSARPRSTSSAPMITMDQHFDRSNPSHMSPVRVKGVLCLVIRIHETNLTPKTSRNPVMQCPSLQNAIQLSKNSFIR